MAGEPPSKDDPEQSDALEQLERALASTPPAATTASASTKEDPLLGAVLLERVRIDTPIARGGMGRVYKGELLRLARPCAVKVLDPRLAGGADAAGFARRFLLEASTAAKLTHPNVVTIYDYGETPDGSCFIAMEYLEGRTVTDEMKALGKISPERAIHIARQVARALREAHGLGVVHRDIKPGNLFLVRRDDDDDFVKVLDFGLVKETAPTEGQEQTQIGQILGSPKYMAPEQVQGGQVDSRTDVYSLGLTLYAMIAGKSPFERPTEMATMMAQVSDEAPALSGAAADVALPPGLEAIVMRCLAKNPDARYASMEELIAALKARPGAQVTASDSGLISAPRLLAPISISSPPPSKRSTWPVVMVMALVVGGALTAALLTRDKSPPSTGGAVGSTQPAPTALPSASPLARLPVTLHVETDPPGVKVKEDGETMCEATPCDIVYSGAQADPDAEHLLAFLKADYRVERKVVKTSASPVHVTLTRAR
jgi:eukaryotic-like serine/threonine-protein kinase